jgi:hypothetical protein
MLHGVLCDYTPLQSDLIAFVALLNHMLTVWHMKPLNLDAFAHVFRFVPDELDQKRQA